MDHWLHHTLWLGNTPAAWLAALLGALLGYAVLHAAARIIGQHLHARAERTRRPGAEVAAAVVRATRGWLVLLIALAAALEFLHFGQTDTDARGVQHGLRLLSVALVGIQAAFWASALLVALLYQSGARDTQRAPNPVMLGVLSWVARTVVWVTLILVLLDQSGVNITAFVASLGVGGVAVALALQNVLGDLFASISIGLDKPFEVGESIAFQGGEGVVARVGIKSTRIRSQTGEELAVSNSVLLQGLIHNYSRMRERRVVFTFRLPFDTARDKIPAAIARVRGFIEGEHPTRFERGYLSGFGDWGLDFEFVYYVLDPAYNAFVEIQQRINLKMLDAWDELGIVFAEPARTLRKTDPGDGVIMRVTGVSE